MTSGAAEPVVWPSNEDESKVPAYVLPDLMKAADGTMVKTVDDWRWKRRPELLATFENGMYGKAPERPKLVFEVLEEATPALEGKALRKQVRVFFTGKKEGLSMDVLLYMPAGITKPVPFFWGLNFNGNHFFMTISFVMQNHLNVFKIILRTILKIGRTINFIPDD